MNQFKYAIIAVLFLSFFLSAEQRDDFDDLITLIDNSDITNLIVNSDPVSTKDPTKADIITILNDLEIPALLQENFFLRTNNLNTRSLLDYPEFLPWRHDKDKRAIYVDLFYNQMSRMNFTKESSNICSYLAIAQPSFRAKLANTARLILEFTGSTITSDEILRLTRLFQTFTVQQRRLGLMIGGKTTFNRWHFNIMAPWYYIERNHFVDDNIKEDIEDLMADLFGAPKTPEEIEEAEKKQNAFIDEHLICDKFGIGDTRIYLDYPVIKKKYLSTRMGFLATIPTAFAMKKGLRGTSLHRVKNRPLLDLVGIVNQAIVDHALPPQALDFGFAALDNLGAMILEPPMGNGGHFGLGIFARNRSPLSSFIKLDWARRFVMRSFMLLEYQFPAVEWRSFRVPVNQALFNARNLDDTSDPLIVNSNYAFIIEQITDRLFPIALQARVHPGVILRWSSQFCYEGDTAGFTLGTDTYVRNKEKLSAIDATPVVKKMIDSFNARAPLSYQSKCVGSVFFKVDKPDRLYTVALGGDYTFMNKGIGADFTLALNFDVTF